MFSNHKKPITYELVVSGKVQGVGYRWYIRSEAQKYGFKGRVRNLYDGTVRILVQGDEAQLEAFIDSLKFGNGYSTVKSITKSVLHTEKTFGGFRIEH